MVKADATLLDPDASKNVTRLLYEICWHCIYGGLKAEQVTSLLNDVTVSNLEIFSSFHFSDQ